MQTSSGVVEPSTSIACPPPTYPIRRRRPSGVVLRLAILIADAAGEILYWNTEAQQAVEGLSGAGPIGWLHDLFPAEALERLRSHAAWTVVKPCGTGDASWRVRSPQPIAGDRSLYLFLAGGASSPELTPSLS